ncbi:MULTISPECIES: DUF3037 domain-containing protein [unclassified Chelatococcus]|uniref:DUF3037 domain-containing protein n=1 Tax=unclassified Chelatococcus TaxID=2638111 RepID=UPI001BCCCE6F|nr:MULTISPECIES: DUF3037 domain-containing protein [unclassified Chelatococcus]CAH1666271.1 conserved hypothetical protein [Hyphomicrobiales bacterium]MBS7737835.1 DUF3037 domain-containing protein [Chelatococcus sp. HY11]MBX3546717.1 DUF3037 domain-containing protein [Chelatococcus sp.]MCO5079289.1 DUF3037 domain-containing protein [Chelatococcus sp.]CAH1680735.1 conserved hypothetical protein [Hyphomicrobiales bacterium]
MTREPYTYMILRYRHDPLAGELVNVGVVVHAARSGFLDALVRRAYGRISKLFPSVDGTTLRHDLVNIERALQRLGKGDVGDDIFDMPNASTFAHRVLGKDDSSLIWSEMGSGLTRDPAKTLEELHARFVTQYDEQPAVRRSDADIWRPFRDLLLERKIDAIFQTKRITGAHDAVEFDYAWKNGKWHCFQPLSFDLTTAEGIQEKAARWVGHMVGLKEAEGQFQPYFIVGEPSDPALMATYDRAVEFIRAAPLRPKIVSESNISEFADELAHKVLEHKG